MLPTIAALQPATFVRAISLRLSRNFELTVEKILSVMRYLQGAPFGAGNLMPKHTQTEVPPRGVEARIGDPMYE
jgi:hypothetical protein